MIIGLCGLAGSGKSQVAKTLVRNHQYARRPFAYPLKCMVGALGISPELLDGPSSEKEKPIPQLCGHSLRYTLQTLGTEWGRQKMGADFWVRLWLQTMPEYDKIVADDVRFSNEAAAVRWCGGVIVKVERVGAGSVVGAKHASETGILQIRPDYVISNNGTVEELETSVAEIVAGVLDAKKNQARKKIAPV